MPRLLMLFVLVSCGCASQGKPDAGTTASGEAGGTSGGGSAGGGSAEVLLNPSAFNTVLGRPTDSSIAVSVLAPGAGAELVVEYGTRLSDDRKLVLEALRTTPLRSTAGEPMVIELTGLQANTRYFYRVHVQPAGQADQADAVHTFHTQRARGSTFHFGVQGDTHPERWNKKMFHEQLFTLTMQEVAKRQPDLYFTLGDDFSNEKIIQDFKAANFAAGYPFTRAVDGVAPVETYRTLSKPFVEAMLVDGVRAPTGSAAWLELRQKYFGLMAPSTALFLTNGNHEQAHQANLGGLFNDASVWAAEARLKYYPLPAPGGFYTGDTQPFSALTPSPGGRANNGYRTLAAPDGLLRDYFAFTWGDALFVTLDPYWHSPEISPDSTLFSDPEPKWGATLGDAQYAWLKQTLTTSTAKWKFVFAHHVNGNNRGAAAIVGVQEWGGEPGFSTNRNPVVWDKPVHQLLADTHVTIFFQGHDHLFAREKVDGVIYQEVPNPGDNSYFAYNCDAYAPASITWRGPAGYGVYDAAYSARLPNTGFLDVAVTPDAVTVQYVRTYRPVDLQQDPNHLFRPGTMNGEVAFTYSVPPRPSDTNPADVPFTCLGAAPPATWGYVP
jgi:hypothetical protein